MTFASITARPQTVISSPAFSGSEKDGRRYSPFTTNVEKRIPWRTLTGRQQYYLDHELLIEFGEQMAHTNRRLCTLRSIRKAVARMRKERKSSCII